MSNLCDSSKNINSFFEDKLPYILFGLFIIALFVFIIVLFLSLKMVKKIDVSEYDFNNESIMYNIERFKINRKGILLEGWAFKKNEALKTVKTYFMLYDKNNNEYIRFSTKKISRPDVAKKLNIGYKIDNCGIRSYIDMDSLKKEHIYEVCILYGNNDNKVIVKTGKFFNEKGELVNE